MLKRVFLLILLAFSVYTAYSQDSAWTNLNLPANLSSDITSFATSGNDNFIGTNGQGVFYTNDGGNTWSNNSLASMMATSFQAILISGSGRTYAIGSNSIFFTTDKGTNWQAIDNFPSQDGSIQCSAVSMLGALAVGTPLSVYYYSENVDGWFWNRLNIQYGPMDVRAMGFNQNEQLFLTCIHRELPRIYLTDPKGQMTFLEIVKDIRESPLASFFELNPQGIMMTGVGKSIYQFDYASNLWTLFTESPQDNVRRIKFGPGHLLSFDDNSLRIFDLGNLSWFPDNPLLHFIDPIVDANLDNNNNIWIIHKRSIYRSEGPIEIIIGFILSKYIKVNDGQGNPMRHKSMQLYKATCDNNQVKLADITTNNSGGFYLNYSAYGLHTGDQIKLERLITTKFATKTGHEDFGGKMYDLYLNNMKFDGYGNPSYYPLTDANPQIITMDHSIQHRFLVISVEWEAKKAYLDTVASWCKLMSNFLYDVTDGQLFVEGVAIYDNYQKWYQADLRIFANNLVWPNAAVSGINSVDSKGDQVRMPRRWLGNTDDTRNWAVRNDWFTYNDYSLQLFMSSTMAHELGHYMFGFYDEYVWVDTNKAKLMPAGYNLGFMQYQYQNAPDWSSEMSDPARYSNPNFRYTAQWAYNGSDCWTQFRNNYQGYYSDPYGGDDLWVPIVFPSDRTLSGGLSYLRGPMDYLTSQNQCSVWPLTTTNIHDQYFGAGDFNFTVVDEYGSPLPKADIYDYVPFFSTVLLKSNQGQSADNGKVTVLGANVNDKIYISAKRELNLGFITIPWFYFYIVNVGAVTGVKDNDNNPQADQVIQLFPVQGEHRLINSMNYDFSGKINFDIFTNKRFNSAPTADIMLADSTVKNFNFTYNSNKSIYSLEVTDALPDQGSVLFNTTDSVNKPFSILFNYQLSDMRKNIFTPNGSAELILDSNNTGIERVSVLSSNFFPLKTGVDNTAKQGGEVVSFSSAPGQISQGTTNILNIRYSKSELTTEDEASLRIFKWDEDNMIWNKIGSSVDTAEGLVSAQISSMGVYAAFTTNNPTGVLDFNDNSFSFSAFPNPFSGTARIEFYLQTQGYVSLKMYNALGDEVMTIANSELGFGKHTFNIEGSQLANGVYYLTLKSGNSTLTKKMILIK